MRFAAFNSNHFFVILILLIGLYAFAYRRRDYLLNKFSQTHLLSAIAGSYSPKKQNIRISMILCAMLLSILALMRPQWGFQWKEVSYRGVDIYLAVDVSKSMLTSDVLPSRLERTKLAIEDLVNNLKGDRIGLIAFSGSAFVQCPLTIDYDGFLLAVEDLGPNIIWRGGTNLAVAIDEARKSFAQGSEGTDRILILITDGESHEGDAILAAEKAKNENIKIYSIGVGTKEGDLIRIIDEVGNSSFLKDSVGQAVKSRINEELLEKVALTSNGLYIKSTATRFGLDWIYKNKIFKADTKETKAKMEKEYEERFQIPLTLAIILIFIEPFIGNRKKKR